VVLALQINLCWKPSFLEKFGNSLKLRMGIRIADATGMTATSQAAITTAISGGVFTSNADNATLQYTSAPLILIQYGLI
jgi:hypothetical protein